MNTFIDYDFVDDDNGGDTAFFRPTAITIPGRWFFQIRCAELVILTFEVYPLIS
jgi:hypothetical protein